MGFIAGLTLGSTLGRWVLSSHSRSRCVRSKLSEASRILHHGCFCGTNPGSGLSSLLILGKVYLAASPPRHERSQPCDSSPTRSKGDARVSKYFIWIPIGLAVTALIYTAVDGPIYPDPYDQHGTSEKDFSNSLPEHK